MRRSALQFFTLLSIAYSQAVASTLSEAQPCKKEAMDRIAEEFGKRLLELRKWGGSGSPRMSGEEAARFEANVRTLSHGPMRRFVWAWLEFRLRNEQALRLEKNPNADAIRQRIGLFRRLLRRYFLYE